MYIFRVNKFFLVKEYDYLLISKYGIFVFGSCWFLNNQDEYCVLFIVCMVWCVIRLDIKKNDINLIFLFMYFNFKLELMYL